MMAEEDVLRQIQSEIHRLDGREINELPPLYDAIDVEALEDVVASGGERVEFRYSEYRIVINHGEVAVHEIS
ncbi:hypothetical protein Halar_0347 (plasmid) [halophilic archaeon DL31]|nr:hypothetical protein Halar_0347 [halophilic archaeon DL31]